jgi:hypothetical protein
MATELWWGVFLVLGSVMVLTALGAIRLARYTTVALREAIHAEVQAGIQSVLLQLSSRREETKRECEQLRATARQEATQTGATARKDATQLRATARHEATQTGATAREEAARVKEAAKIEAEQVTRKAREERAALEEEKAAMEKAHTFQQNNILLDVGGRALHPSTFQPLNLSRFVAEIPPKIK